LKGEKAAPRDTKLQESNQELEEEKQELETQVESFLQISQHSNLEGKASLRK
jgi:hypothetical protein